MNNRERQAAFKAAMRSKGFVYATEWVPSADRERFRDVARALRDGTGSDIEPVTGKASAPTPDTDDTAALRRKLADAQAEVARLNRESDRLAIENDSLKRRLKAMDARESDLCKRLDAAVAERDQARAAKVQAEADLAIHRDRRTAR